MPIFCSPRSDSFPKRLHADWNLPQPLGIIGESLTCKHINFLCVLWSPSYKWLQRAFLHSDKNGRGDPLVSFYQKDMKTFLFFTYLSNKSVVWNMPTLLLSHSVLTTSSVFGKARSPWGQIIRQMSRSAQKPHPATSRRPWRPRLHWDPFLTHTWPPL